MSAIALSPDVTIGHRAEAVALIAALRNQLESLHEVIAALPAHVYLASPSHASGSIGAQVRHCLDHVRAVVVASKLAEISYDARLRGTRVETDPDTAIDEIHRLSESLDELSSVSLNRAIRLKLQPDRERAPVTLLTTFGREVAFATQHTIHHGAIIRMLIERTGITTRPDFGYAHSTPLMANSQAEAATSQAEIRS